MYKNKHILKYTSRKVALSWSIASECKSLSWQEIFPLIQSLKDYLAAFSQDDMFSKSDLNTISAYIQLQSILSNLRLDKKNIINLLKFTKELLDFYQYINTKVIPTQGLENNIKNSDGNDSDNENFLTFGKRNNEKNEDKTTFENSFSDNNSSFFSLSSKTLNDDSSFLNLLNGYDGDNSYLNLQNNNKDNSFLGLIKLQPPLENLNVDKILSALNNNNTTLLNSDDSINKNVNTLENLCDILNRQSVNNLDIITPRTTNTEKVIQNDTNNVYSMDNKSVNNVNRTNSIFNEEDKSIKSPKDNHPSNYFDSFPSSNTKTYEAVGSNNPNLTTKEEGGLSDPEVYVRSDSLFSQYAMNIQLEKKALIRLNKHRNGGSFSVKIPQNIINKMEKLYSELKQFYNIISNHHQPISAGSHSFENENNSLNMSFPISPTVSDKSHGPSQENTTERFFENSKAYNEMNDLLNAIEKEIETTTSTLIKVDSSDKAIPLTENHSFSKEENDNQSILSLPDSIFNNKIKARENDSNPTPNINPIKLESRGNDPNSSLTNNHTKAEESILKKKPKKRKGFFRNLLKVEHNKDKEEKHKSPQNQLKVYNNNNSNENHDNLSLGESSLNDNLSYTLSSIENSSIMAENSSSLINDTKKKENIKKDLLHGKEKQFNNKNDQDNQLHEQSFLSFASTNSAFTTNTTTKDFNNNNDSVNYANDSFYDTTIDNSISLSFHDEWANDSFNDTSNNNFINNSRYKTPINNGSDHSTNNPTNIFSSIHNFLINNVDNNNMNEQNKNHPSSNYHRNHSNENSDDDNDENHNSHQADINKDEVKNVCQINLNDNKTDENQSLHQTNKNDEDNNENQSLYQTNKNDKDNNENQSQSPLNHHGDNRLHPDSRTTNTFSSIDLNSKTDDSSYSIDLALIYDVLQSIHAYSINNLPLQVQDITQDWVTLSNNIFLFYWSLLKTHEEEISLVILYTNFYDQLQPRDGLKQAKTETPQEFSPSAQNIIKKLEGYPCTLKLVQNLKTSL